MVDLVGGGSVIKGPTPSSWTVSRSVSLTWLVHTLMPSWKKKSGIIQFTSNINKFTKQDYGKTDWEYMNIHELDVLRILNEMNIIYIFSENKIKCDICKYITTTSTVLERHVTLSIRNPF